MPEEVNLLMKIYKSFVKTAAVLKYSGVLMLSISILALIAYFKLNNVEVFIYAIAIIIVSFICFTFSAIIERKDPVIKYGLYIFIYVVIFTLSACVISFANFIFFQKPNFYKRWFPDMTYKKEVNVDLTKPTKKDYAPIVRGKKKLGTIFQARKQDKGYSKINTNNNSFLFNNKSEKSKGTATFDYSNNDGRFQIGREEYIFETMWSKASNKSVHAYKDSPTIQSIALVTDKTQINDIIFPNVYDTTSRVRTPQINEIIIWKNKHGLYAATKIIDIKDRTRGDSVDLLKIEYVIQTQ